MKRVLLPVATLTIFGLNTPQVFGQQATSGASAPVTRVRPCRYGPLEKNTMAPNTLACSEPAPAPQQLTNRQLRRLAASAHSSEKHLQVAESYRRHAAELDAEAASFGQVAPQMEHVSTVKNMVAPNTAARYKRMAEEQHVQAMLERSLADSQQQLAKNNSVNESGS